MMAMAVMYLDCPAYLDEAGTARCGLPAEVESWFSMSSTGGPLESAKIRCPRGHWFNAPVEFLVLPGPPSRAERAGSPGQAIAARRRAARPR